jgi:hypothetical protein
MGRLSAALALSATVASGCRGQSAPAAPGTAKTQDSAASAAPRESDLGELRNDGWERAGIARLAVTLELPDANGWREGGGGSWATLEHVRSHSRLELNLTRAERLARPEDCEARARLGHPELPRPAEGEALDQQRLAVPRGFLTYATLSVNEAGSSILEGHVTAFGAAVSRCFAFHFVTRVAGAGAETEVARRLGLVAERVLPSLALRAVDDRVSPEPFSRGNAR